MRRVHNPIPIMKFSRESGHSNTPFNLAIKRPGNDYKPQKQGKLNEWAFYQNQKQKARKNNIFKKKQSKDAYFS
jgi:hypothetical protein